MPTPPRSPRIDPTLPASTLPVDAAQASHDGEWSASEINGDGTTVDFEHSDIAGCRFAGAALTGVSFADSRIVDTEFVDCELSGADFDTAALTRVAFVRCRISSANFGGARLTDVAITASKANDLNLRMTKLERCAVHETVIEQSDFTGSQGAEIAFVDSDLSATVFTNARLKNLVLYGSTLTELVGASALKGATIDSNQVLPFALALFAAHAVKVSDDRS